jgi:hypothetical protein
VALYGIAAVVAIALVRQRDLDVRQTSSVEADQRQRQAVRIERLKQRVIELEQQNFLRFAAGVSAPFPGAL